MATATGDTGAGTGVEIGSAVAFPVGEATGAEVFPCAAGETVATGVKDGGATGAVGVVGTTGAVGVTGEG